MQQTPIGMRRKIVFVGRTNVGKSSLINAIVGDEISITSDKDGTTTDSVSKAFEILDFGPVQLYDTAGFGDESPLGSKRREAAVKTLKSADLAVLVVASEEMTKADIKVLEQIESFDMPYIIVYNKNDLYQYDKNKLSINSLTKKGVRNLLREITKQLQKMPDKKLLDGIVKSGDKILLVMPQDGSAPKGRLIMPQVQMIRELIDAHTFVTCIALEELAQALTLQKYDLVISDSKVVKEVLKVVPPTQKVSTFSILFARMKGDFYTLLNGLEMIDLLKDNDKILIAESCVHTTKEDDIAKAMIPKVLARYTGKKLTFEFAHGKTLPENLTDYKLILQCGGCVLTPKEVQNRIHSAFSQGVSISNFGLVLTKCRLNDISRLTF